MVKLLLLLLALSFAVFAEQPADPQYQDTKYVPMCFETNKGKREENKNMIFLMTGTGAQPFRVGPSGPYNPVDATFKVGYFRTVKDDLSLGLVTDWTRLGGFDGCAVGFGYRF